MVNICEPLINAVSSDKPKVLTGLDQNGAWDGVAGWLILRPQATTPTGEEAGPNRVDVVHVERGKPHVLSGLTPWRQPSASEAYGTGGMGCRSKRTLGCNRQDRAVAYGTRTYPPGNRADFLLVLDGETAQNPR